jgi:hypothetical protein
MTTRVQRTAEGWLIVDTERREDDPHVFDDCWHRGPYWIYSVRGTSIRVESQPNDRIGAMWDRLEVAMRAAGLTGTIELMGDSVKGLDYRRIMSIPTQAELDEMKQRAEEASVLYAGIED